jgi:DNA-binding transcriptional LysR family regulator
MTASYQHLRAFHAIAIERGVSRAARRLNVSQPTLSQQLKALEARHAVSLFENRKSPLELSAAGRDLFTLTQRLFATASDIDDMLGETSGLAGGVLRLGSDSPLHAARVVGRFRASHPSTGVQVRMGNAREVMQWLGEAQIDAALASDPPADAMFSYDPLYTDRLRCALPVGHPLAARDAIPIALLADEVLLAGEATSKTRAFTERALADAGVAPAATLELQGRETIREAIALGLGLSIVFSSECPPDRRIAYRPLDTGACTYELRGFLLCRSERRRSTLMRALKIIVCDLRTQASASSHPVSVRAARVGASIAITDSPG